MPYVRRDRLGRIESLHREAGTDALEELPEGHPEVLAFVGAGSDNAASFQRLDADFVRVVEDLIDVLIARNLISITDLPAEAQNKLFARKSFRESASRHALRLFGETGVSEVVDDTDFMSLR